LEIYNINILCINSCTSSLEVGNFVDNEKLISKSIDGYKSGESIVKIIEEILDNDYSKLDKICCSVGPGSYTGIRIGITVAKTMSSVLKIPAFGISTLEAIAVSSKSPDGIACVDSRCNFFFIQEFRNNKMYRDIEKIDKEKCIEKYREYNIVNNGILEGVVHAKGGLVALYPFCNWN
jgi:tRNA threonylcarbamoyl adenosine modification protein YeaZ